MILENGKEIPFNVSQHTSTKLYEHVSPNPKAEAHIK